MFQWVGSTIDWHKKWFERAMTEPDINSRMVFLLHGGVTALSILFVTVAFIIVTTFTIRSTEHFEHVIMALGGGGAGAAVGRYFTKKNSSGPQDDALPQPPPDAPHN